MAREEELKMMEELLALVMANNAMLESIIGEANDLIATNEDAILRAKALLKEGK